MKSENEYDVAIIGGGHNGMTCACYLAKAGLKVNKLLTLNIFDLQTRKIREKIKVNFSRILCSIS